MADSNLTALPEVAASTDDDLLYTVQGGNSRKTTRAKVIAPAVRHDAAQALTETAKTRARSNISAAALGSDGIVPREQLPDSLFAGTGAVDDEAAMLALDVPVGFTAVRRDVSKNFVLTGLPASDIANWTELASPTAPVLSVAGKQGAVELEIADISELGDLNLLPVQTSTTDGTPDRLMKTGAFGLGGIAIAITSTSNLNNLPPYSAFYTWGASAPSNAPNTWCSMLHIQRHASSLITQVVFGDAGDVWIRIWNGTAWSNFVRQVKSVAGRTGDVNLTKSDVGLGNVSNTAPADLPVSNATQNSLNGKMSKSGDTFTNSLWGVISGNAPMGLGMRSGADSPAIGAFNISPVLRLQIPRGAYGVPDGAYGQIQYEENVGTSNQIVFNINGFSSNLYFRMQNDGSFTAPGPINGSAKNFEIDHPADPDFYDLRHCSTEAPEMLVEYRGRAKLQNGRATVNVEDYFGVMPDTFKNLWADAWVMSLQNQDGFDRLKPRYIDPVTFEIECENLASEDEVTWLLMARRNDPYVHDQACTFTDAEGRLIVEFEKPD